MQHHAPSIHHNQYQNATSVSWLARDNKKDAAPIKAYICFTTAPSLFLNYYLRMFRYISAYYLSKTRFFYPPYLENFYSVTNLEKFSEANYDQLKVRPL